MKRCNGAIAALASALWSSTQGPGCCRVHAATGMMMATCRCASGGLHGLDDDVLADALVAEVDEVRKSKSTAGQEPLLEAVLDHGHAAAASARASAADALQRLVQRDEELPLYMFLVTFTLATAVTFTGALLGYI